MTLNLSEECTNEFEFDCKEVAFQVMNAVLDSEKCPYEATVDLTLTTDSESMRLICSRGELTGLPMYCHFQ